MTRAELLKAVAKALFDMRDDCAADWGAPDQRLCHLEEAETALAAIEAAGFAVVPRETTPNMNAAHLRSVCAHGKRESHLHWRAMIAASPVNGGDD